MHIVLHARVSSTESGPSVGARSATDLLGSFVDAGGRTGANASVVVVVVVVEAAAAAAAGALVSSIALEIFFWKHTA